MTTCRSDDAAKQGQLIADSIRKILLNADLRLVYARGEAELAEADYILQARNPRASSQKKAVFSKARCECFKNYIQEIEKAKSDITTGLDKVLERYNPKKKRVWVMYFIEQAPIQEIAAEVNYAPRNVDKIVQQFKLDLTEFYEKQ